MKKLLLSSWCIFAALLLFVSCNQKKNIDAPENNALVGSSWLSTSTHIENSTDTVFIFTSNVAIKFLDDTSGVIVSDHRVFINDSPELADQPVRTPFSYTFENDKGVMTLDFGKEDTVHGFPRFVENSFNYDKEKQTITNYGPNGKVLNEFTELK